MLRKLLLILGGFVVLLLLSAAILPVIFKDKIETAAKEEINRHLHAKVNWSSFGLSFFRHFPNLSCSLGDLSVVGEEPFEGDTLLSVGSFDAGVNFWDLVSGSGVVIRFIELDRPRINVIVLEDGTANYDIALEDTTAAAPGEETAFELSLRKYTISEGHLVYDDRSMGLYMGFDRLEHTGSGDFTQDLFDLRTKTTIGEATLKYGGIRYLGNASLGIEADLEIDMPQSRYTFKDNKVSLNELEFGVDGWVALNGEAIEMDLKLNAAENEFRHFLSLVPGIYSDQFSELEASGKLSLSAFVKGTYVGEQIPGFTFDVKVADGAFRYPALPAGVDNVQLDLSVGNPDGNPDHTVISLAKLHLEMAGQPFDARLVVKTPVSDPDIDMSAKGSLDLGSIGRIVPLAEGTTLSGMLAANMEARGRASAMERKQFDKFRASGKISLSDFSYRDAANPDIITISSCTLGFNPQNVSLSDFSMQAGRTDVQASGTLNNVAGYFFSNDLLSGYLDIRSNQVDLNPYITESEPGGTGGGTDSIGVLEIPAHIDFVMTASIGKVLYEDLVLENAGGNLAIRERVLGLNNVRFGLLGGQVTMNGLYGTRNPERPDINFDLAVERMDIRKTFDHFIAVRKLAPIAGKCNGMYSSAFKISGQLDAGMNPVYESMNGKGVLRTYGVTVDNFEPLVKVADALRMERFRNATLSDANLSFKISGGRVYVEPFEQTIAGIDTRIEGSNGMDESIDYTWTMKLPVKSLPSAATGVVSGLFAKANAAGANLKMGETVNVKLNIGGTVSKPVVKTDLKDVAGAAASGLKDQAAAALDAKKKELEAQAKEKSDSLRREAEDKAKAEADRIKKEAEEKAKAEAERLKKEAEEKAKKEIGNKLKDLFGK